MALKKKTFKKRTAKKGHKQTFAKKVLKVLDKELEMHTDDQRLTTNFLTPTAIDQLSISHSGFFNQVTGALLNGNGMLRICSLNSGTLLGERIGNTVSVRRIELRGKMQLPDVYTENNSTFRMVVFRHSPNGTPIPAADMLVQDYGLTVTPFSQPNINKRSQYRIVYDKTFTITNGIDGAAPTTVQGPPTTKLIKIKKTFKDLNMSWNNNSLDAPPGTNTSDFCNKNHLYFVIYGQDPAFPNPMQVTPFIQGNWRCFYHTD